MVVHAAFATILASTPRREGVTLGKMKLSPIAKALRERAKPLETSPAQAT